MHYQRMIDCNHRSHGLGFRLCTSAFVAVMFLLWASMSAHAQPLPLLSEDDRDAWSAVGVVNLTGPEGFASCSGTLIAPDLVLTAAHCAGRESKTTSGRHFMAGWQLDEYTAYSASARVDVHPAYSVAKGAKRFEFDIAVIQLQNPIPAHLVKPVALATADLDQETVSALLGYHRLRPKGLNGRFDCLARPFAHSIEADCPVVSGNSGGALMIKEHDEWRVAAVLVAQIKSKTRALAVPVSTWVRDHLDAAQDREAARRAAN